MKAEEILLYGGLGLGALYLANKFLRINVGQEVGRTVGSTVAGTVVGIPQGAYEFGYQTGYEIGRKFAQAQREAPPYVRFNPLANIAYSLGLRW